MDTREFPTKGNLIANKNTLALARMGYELMDKKRNVLVSEIVSIIDQIREITAEINGTFSDSYKALEQANVQLGVVTVRDMASAVPICDDVMIYTRSVMDSEIPVAEYQVPDITPAYPFFKTNESLDIARIQFSKVRELVVKMAVLENAAFRLSANINKAQKRANALKNITIPRYEELVKNISSSLEEKEREEFTRLKVIKKNKQKSGEEQ